MDTNKTDKKTLTIRIVIFAFIMVAIIVMMRIVVGASQTSTEYNSFAQCLTDKGLKFYGAFWCPHCQAQKAEFGGSVKFLPYVECSTPDAKGQTQVCIDNKIASYPTWQFPDGSRVTGVQDLSTLSEKSGCPLPTGSSTSTSSTAATAGASTAVTQ